MANTFFEPGRQRGERVQELFARIAHRYDLINDLQSFGLHRRWKARLVDLAAPAMGLKGLDVCCGTGDLAFRLAARGVQVTGLDFSEAMLQEAEKRARRFSRAGSAGHPVNLYGENPSAFPPGEPAKAGTPNVTTGSVRFIPGDAQQLPFPDKTFDIVTIGYGLRNLADWRLGLGEMARVCKPGGRLLVLDFGKPDNPAWRALYFAYLRCFVPVLGLVFAGSASAYAYILESLKHYPAQHGVASAMNEMRLANVRIVNFLGGVMTLNYGEREN